MSVSNEDGLPPALALDETPARLGASPESITRQVPDITYPALSSPGWHDAREASATTPLPSKALGAVAAHAKTFDLATATLEDFYFTIVNHS